jgi:hypothetical protein
MRPRVLFAAVCALSLALSHAAHADEQGDLEKGQAAYFAKEYDDADQRFRAMLDPDKGTLHDPLFVAEARMYWGATLLALKRDDDATAVFTRLLLDKPDYEPDQSRLPPSVVFFFIDVRTKIRDKLAEDKARKLREEIERKKREEAERQRQARELTQLKKLASEELVVQNNSRLFALIPFGAGQFQNKDKGLGWFFLVTEGTAALVATIAFIDYRIQLANAHDVSPLVNEANRTPFEQYISRANAARAVNLIAAGVGVVAGVTGIVQAEVAFVPMHDVETKHRDIPLVSRVTPLVAPATEGNGVVLGVGGRF